MVVPSPRDLVPAPLRSLWVRLMGATLFLLVVMPQITLWFLVKFEVSPALLASVLMHVKLVKRLLAMAFSILSRRNRGDFNVIKLLIGFVSLVKMPQLRHVRPG